MMQLREDSMKITNTEAKQKAVDVVRVVLERHQNNFHKKN
jgi:hypothetical protein